MCLMLDMATEGNVPVRSAPEMSVEEVDAIHGLQRLRDPAQFPAWIYGIATRKCADVIRANRRRHRLETDAGVAPSKQGPGTELEQRIDLATAVRQLPPMHRAVIHLFYREDLSVEEIGQVLGIPAGTVKSRLHHARSVLRRELGEARSAR